MSVRLDKPWLPLDEVQAGLPAKMGVFQLADATGEICCIGYAGGHSLRGLVSAVEEALERFPLAVSVRYEVTTAYLSRYRELMMLHQADFGHPAPTPHNDGYGRLSPA